MTQILSYNSWLKENRQRLDREWSEVRQGDKSKAAERSWLYKQYRRENHQ